MFKIRDILISTKNTVKNENIVWAVDNEIDFDCNVCALCSLGQEKLCNIKTFYSSFLVGTQLCVH